MYLSGYGQEQYQQAVRDMVATFEEDEAIACLGQYLAGTAAKELITVKRGQFQKPPASDMNWMPVQGYLRDKLKLPGYLLAKAHETGMLYSDRRMNCVFLRDKDSGAFTFNINGREPFGRSLGSAEAPYLLPGSDNTVYITGSPLEALCLKALRPDSTILATGGIMSVDKLKPYLAGREIFLAQGRDKNSESYARYVAEWFSQAKRLPPTNGQTWMEEWLLHKEEKERARRQAISMESTRHKTSAVERADEALKPASGMWR
jgi:hypothetical protein